MEELFETQNIEPSESVRLVIDNLWNAIYGFVDKYQRQSEQLKVIRDENVRLNLEHEQALRRIEDLERLIQELRNEPGDTKFAELEAENIRLRKEIEELRQRQNDLFQSSQIPTTSLFDTSETEPQYQALQKEYKFALEEVASKDQTIAEMKNKISDLENQTDALKNQLTRMGELEKINAELNAQIEILKQGKEKDELFFEEQQNKILELTNKNDELAKLVEELQYNIHRQSTLDQDLENTKRLLDEKRSEMESIAKEIEVYRVSIDELSNQIDLLNAEIQQLKEKNQSLQAEIDALVQKNDEKEQKISELLQYKREFYRIQSDANSLRQINKEVKELMNQITDEKVELERKVYRLLKEKADLQEKVLDYERQKENMGIILNEKNKEFEIVNSELLSLKATLRDKEVTKKLLLNKVETLIGKIDKILEVYN